ncbi:hypothetical protein [Shinella sp. DD12]|uniref:hypothetical protein n=1 Tax=Shinella sp. DD12 TaxID=1410620 RepID=UPI0003C55068|nr:hypothetical protein [Shinella sp. DD12]EYR81918.1 hypothetical protein SHLA_4c002100 [Shinella sp. DD12]
MAESMIERVARAIFEECNRQSPVAGFGYADADGDKTVLDGAYDLKAVARAAIEAMREPSGEMLSAGIKRGVAWDYGERGDPDEPPHTSEEAIYIAMINAALKETNP